MASNHSQPYQDLTPDVVLDALESVGLRGDGRLLALNSYENRVYQVSLEDDSSVVAKFYRPNRWSDAQLLEEHTFALELAEREIPVVAPLELGGQTLNTFNDIRFAVFPRRGGRPPELEDEKVLVWIGRFLGRIHAVGATRPFKKRPALNLDTFGTEPRDWLLASGMIPEDLQNTWVTTIDLALQGVRNCFARTEKIRAIRLHGDCHVGNILWTEAGNRAATPGMERATGLGGPHFVDLDDARMGPAVQDLWMLLAGDRETAAKQLKALLEGYEQFHGFNREELGLIEPLRTLRLIHYSAWLARRWEDPAFPAAFPWFGTQRYWQDRILELREQTSDMDEAPLSV
ncbi:MAG: serine/threonine protein kinase [Betaproteobacteria bacterium]|nr:serine/threonine protein kinase [Betaproteobacteria bacterium]